MKYFGPGQLGTALAYLFGIFYAAPLPAQTAASTLDIETGAAFTRSYSVPGGTTPTQCELYSGTIPPGLVLTPANCLISGIPTTPGGYAFAIYVPNLKGGINPATHVINVGTTSTPYLEVISGLPANFTIAYCTTVALLNGCPSTGYVPTTSTAYLTVNTTVRSGIAYNVQSSVSWLTLRASGATITATVNATGLARGIYSGFITVTASGVANSPQRVPVYLSVTGGGSGSTNIHSSFLTYTPDALNLPGDLPSTCGQSGNKTVCTIDVDNQSGPVTVGTAAATTRDGRSWISITQSRTVTPLRVTVTIDPTGLPSGNYAGDIALGTVDVYTVTLALTQNGTLAAPVIKVDKPDLTVELTTGTAATPPPSINITSTGTNTDYEAQASTQDGNPWLAPNPYNSRKTPDQLTLVVDATNLNAGKYEGTVTIAAGSPLIAPATVKVHLTVDAAAPITTGGLYFIPVTPCHLADTRPGTGTSGEFGWPSLDGGGTRTLRPPAGNCPGIPATAKAYSLHFTAIPTDGFLGYMTAWPAGQARPRISTLNAPKGGAVSNDAIVPAGVNGAISVFVTDASDIMIDVNGYYDSTPGGQAYAFYALKPCRMIDTRYGGGTLGPPALTAGQTRSFPITTSPCLPAGANAGSYVVNATVVPMEPLNSVSIFAFGTMQAQLVTNVTSPFADVVASAATVHAGLGGAISVYSSNMTNFLLDINGYFALPGNPGAMFFHPITPCRIADTREPSGPFGGPALIANTPRTFQIPQSQCGLPADAGAYSLNVTVQPTTSSLGFLTLWPAGQTQPAVSTLNSWDGRVVPNAAIVPAGQNGAINVLGSDPTHVILDVNGYFSSH